MSDEEAFHALFNYLSLVMFSLEEFLLLRALSNNEIPCNVVFSERFLLRVFFFKFPNQILLVNMVGPSRRTSSVTLF